jgi:hypothetical protein
MRCQHFFKNGNQCKNKAIGDLYFCHIRAHQNDMVAYNETIEKLQAEFISSTINMNNFSLIRKITKNGACAYQCMVWAVYYRNIHKIKNQKDILIDHESDYSDKFIELLRSSRTSKNNVDDNKISDNIDDLANLMQQIVREWIMEHRDYIVDNISTLEEYVLMCHDGFDNIDEYNAHYQEDASKEIIYEVETGKFNKKGKPIIEKIYIDDRWGGSPEIYAFSKIFGMEVNIYLLKRFSTSQGKKINGSLRDKSSRAQLVNTFNENCGLPVYFLLLNDNSEEPHYTYIS